MIIELATCDELRELWRDDLPLVAELEARGATVRPWVWREPASATCDIIVVRTTWDYWDHLDEFRGWLGGLADRGALVINPPPLMTWNLDKRYLVELQRRGVKIPKTVVLEGRAQLADVAKEIGSETVVAKPVFSAGGWHAHLLKLGDEGSQLRLDELVAEQSPLLVQEFLPEIKDGELSLIYFDGSYSHAVIKRAKDGEFRVQTEHGGTVAPATPAAEIITSATSVLDKLPYVPSYARVDGVVRDNEFVLMELELIEPELFLEYEDRAAKAFADVILRRSV